MIEPFTPSEAEQRLIEAAASGQIADFSCGDQGKDDPVRGNMWGPERSIRAEIIAVLATSTEPRLPVHRQGVLLQGARITGSLDLFAARDLPPLAFVRCYFEERLSFRLASAKVLSLKGSFIPMGVYAPSLQVEESLVLGEGFRALDRVELGGARVGGQLILNGGRFQSSSGPALQMDLIRVGGGLTMANGFSARGEVKLAKAYVEGQLACSGSFENAGGAALTMDGIEVNGDVFLRPQFFAQGEVRLVGGRIKGNIECDGARLENRGGYALNMDLADVKGAVTLRNKFSARGGVRLLGATIAAQLDCNGGRFTNPTGEALTMDGAKVGVGVFLGDGFRAEGEARMVRGLVDGNLECRDGSFENPDGDALSLDGIKVGGDAFLGHGFRVKGEVRILGARIEGQLDCTDGQFNAPRGRALSLDGTEVNNSVSFAGKFSASGEVRLVDTRVRDQIDCSGGNFQNPDGYALNAERATVGGALFIRDGFRANGVVNLSHARVGVLADDVQSWAASGPLLLEGLTYGGVLAARDSKDRLSWLARQREFHPQPYQQLARVFRAIGQAGDARAVLFAMHKRMREEGRLDRWGCFANWLLEATIGYGYKPWFAFVWLFLLFLLGTCLAYFAWASGAMIPARAPATGVRYPRFHASLYSVEEFSLPPLDIVQKTAWRLGERRPHDPVFWLCEIYFTTHALAGWLLAGLLIAALTGVIRRE